NCFKSSCSYATQKYQIKLTKLNWQHKLGVVAITLGFMGIIDSAQAIPTQNTFQLAQVGVRSQINAPTSLNITPPPGSHIPLPESNYDGYGSYDHEQPDSSEDYIYYKDSRGYRRHESNYDDDYYHHEYQTHRHHNQKSGNIIIINLPSETNYDSTNNTYIRIFRR
ncbi:MAG: hypothetical protein ACRC8K_02515, partial [Waterburya sp.]